MGLLAGGAPTFRKIRRAVRFAQVKEEAEGRGTRSKTHSPTDLEQAKKYPPNHAHKKARKKRAFLEGAKD
jgi:hypothetical protein